MIEGAIIKRKYKDLKFKIVSIENYFAKIIRIDDIEHRRTLKKEAFKNDLFISLFGRKRLLRMYDKPGYVFVPKKDLIKHFTLIT